MRRSIVVAVGEECKETLARLFLKHRLVGWRDMRHETADRASSSAETSAVTPRSQSSVPSHFADTLVHYPRNSTPRGTQLLGATQHPGATELGAHERVVGVEGEEQHACRSTTAALTSHGRSSATDRREAAGEKRSAPICETLLGARGPPWQHTAHHGNTRPLGCAAAQHQTSLFATRLHHLSKAFREAPTAESFTKSA